MQIGRLALCPKQFLQKSVDDKKRLSTSGGWSLQEQPQLLGREKRSSFWVNFEHVRWGGVSFVRDGSQEACSLIGGMVQTNGTRICEINILEYMRVSSKNSTIILGAKTCEGLPTEICLCYTCTWVQVVIWILKIYAKDNLQFWARYQNDSSKNGHILAWTWVLAKSKQTFTFFRGQTFLKMNLQGDDDDDDDDDQTFLIAINMNLQGSHRETQRHSRTACGPSSNPKFKTILTHFMWYVPSPSFFYNPHHHTQRNWCHW